MREKTEDELIEETEHKMLLGGWTSIIDGVDYKGVLTFTPTAPGAYNVTVNLDTREWKVEGPLRIVRTGGGLRGLKEK